MTDLDDLRTYLALGSNVNLSDDSLLAAIAAGNQWVDNYCGRQFTVVDPDTDTATARIFPTLSPCHAMINDLAATDDLVVETSWDRSTWTTITGYYLQPDNIAVESDPYTTIRVNNYGTTTVLSPWIRVTGHWGWLAIPAPVKQARLLTWAWLYKRADSPFGISGFDGMPMRVSSAGDPDVARLLAPYRRVDVVVGIA